MSNITLYPRKKGFTLIELLVVISIIGMMSSIVLASVATTRVRAQDSSIRQVALQLRNVYELESLKSNSYAALMPAGVSGAGYICSASMCTITLVTGCTGFYGANSEGEKICKDVFSKKSNLAFGITGGGTVSDDYSFFMILPSDPSTGVCVRSKGVLLTVANSTTCANKSLW